MPLSKRQVYRRRRIVVFGGALLVLGVATYLPVTLLAPLAVETAHVQPWTAPATEAPTLGFPGYGAVAVGAVGYPGVLASSGTADPLPIASITKVVTALMVLETHPLALGEAGPAITFTDSDQQFYDNGVAQDAVVAPVVPGATISERNMLDVMLMESANNYADTVAVWAFGSEPAFVTAAAAWLAEQGLSHTTVTDPTGILPSNTSTTADLIELGKLALANPVVAQIVGTATLDVPGVGVVANRNELLGIDDVDGIKTGTLDEAGSCLLFSAKKTVGDTTVQIVGVALGGPDHPTVAADMHGLLDQVTAGFHEVPLVTAGQVFAGYDTPWGDTATAVAAEDASVVTWASTPVSVAIHAADIRLVHDGTSAGKLVFSAGAQVVTVPLKIAGSIEDPGAWWRLTHPGQL